jgi:hypothetical protein
MLDYITYVRYKEYIFVFVKLRYFIAIKLIYRHNIVR